MQFGKQIQKSAKRELGWEKQPIRKAASHQCGYWQLWRYNPALEDQGQNPFSLDSKEPDWSKFSDFLKGEVRFASIFKAFPDVAQELFDAAQANARWRYANYVRLSQQQWGKDPLLTPEEESLRSL